MHASYVKENKKVSMGLMGIKQGSRIAEEKREIERKN
jgi:hypothetical protein